MMTMVAIHTTYDDLAILIPDDARTLAGFREWARSDSYPDWGRICFIGQEIYVDMSPEKIEAHAKIKAEIARVIGTLVKEANRGEFYPDRCLFTNEEAQLSTEPDSSFASWPTIELKRLQFVGGGEDAVELAGTLDWVLEVVSDSSVVKDTEVLRKAYHRAGVGEYWLVDGRKDLSFNVLVREKDGFIEAESREGWRYSTTFGRWFHLDRRRGRLGRWEYLLAHTESV